MKVNCIERIFCIKSAAIMYTFQLRHIQLTCYNVILHVDILL